jgi:hypothetical protein
MDLLSELLAQSLHPRLEPVSFMLSKCANPSCTASFRYFHQGKLFRMEVETSQPDEAVLTRAGKSVRRAEFFWLCDRCRTRMTLEHSDDGGVQVKPVAGGLLAAS